MYALYDTATGLIQGYYETMPPILPGQSCAKTSVTDDVNLYDCYVQEVKWDEIHEYNYIVALKSYKKGIA